MAPLSTPVKRLVDIPSMTARYRRSLAAAQAAAAAKRSPDITPSQRLNDIVSHVHYTITRLEVDAIVNAANRSLLGGGGVDGAIHAAAGDGLVDECRTLGGCSTGDAKISGAHNLGDVGVSRIIHGVGPVYSAERVPAELLRCVYWRSMSLASQYEVKSVAFTCISAGIYGYPRREAAGIAMCAVRDFLNMYPNTVVERVVFCTFEKKDADIYEEELPLYFPPTQEDLGIPVKDDTDANKNDDNVDKDAAATDGDLEKGSDHKNDAEQPATTPPTDAAGDTKAD